MDFEKILNCVINKQFNTPTYPDLFMKSNKPISAKKETTNGFNNFFFKCWPKYCKHVLLPGKDVSIYDYLGKGLVSSMFLSPVEDQGIIRTVQQFENKMSRDFSDINMNMKTKQFLKL